MISNHLLQLNRCLGQVVNMEGHILYQTGGANRARTTHRGEDTRTDGPVLAVDLRILSKLSRDIQTELRQAFLYRLHFLHQLLMGHGLSLGQDSCEVMVVAGLHTGNLSGIHIFLILQIDGIIHRAKRFIVEHLGTLYNEVLGTHLQVFIARLQFLHGYHCLTTLLHRLEINHRRCLIRIVVERLHRYLREESQCSFRAYHTVGHDIERIIISE